jgi:hypothetical protein
LSGFQLDGVVRKFVLFLPTIVSLGAIVWDVFIWRLPLVRRFVKRPWLTGCWIVVLNSTDESHIPEGGNRGPILAFIVIHQTFWSIFVRQYTFESESWSRSFFWHNGYNPDVESLTFTYENAPGPQYQHRSTRHYGSASLRSSDKTPLSVAGEYFTDRYTAGSIRMIRVSRKTTCGSFEDGARAATIALDDKNFGSAAEVVEALSYAKG